MAGARSGVMPFRNGSSALSCGSIRKSPSVSRRTTASSKTGAREQDHIDRERMDGCIQLRGTRPAGMISERKKGYIVRS